MERPVIQRTLILERLRGRGDLLKDGVVVASGVAYSVIITVDQVLGAPGEWLDGLKDANGTVDGNVFDLVGEDIVLRLEDDRRWPCCVTHAYIPSGGGDLSSRGEIR